MVAASVGPPLPQPQALPARHKSQGITLDQIVCDISAPEFASGLSYVAVSRVSKLQGLMFDCPFERSRVCRDPPTRAMQLKLADYKLRQLTRLEQHLYEPEPYDNEESSYEEEVDEY